MFVKKTKGVTEPLADKVKAQIVGWDRVRVIEPGYASSGSEHSAHQYHGEDDAACSSNLSELFYGFGFDDGSSPPERCDESDSDSDRASSSIELNADAIEPSILLMDQRDEFQKLLRVNVLKAFELYSKMNNTNTNKQMMIRRNVMAFLRNCGYNAAICKTKWESTGGLTAGNHEFIDVVHCNCSSSVRYFVDLDFASEFEIARPTSAYERLIQHVPAVFVGKCDELKRILRLASDAARRSLRSRDLTVPPWRKHRFMQNKWLGPYRRTTNVYPALFCGGAAVAKPVYGGGVKCQAVGFDVNVNGGRMSLPAIGRTR